MLTPKVDVLTSCHKFFMTFTLFTAYLIFKPLNVSLLEADSLLVTRCVPSSVVSPCSLQPHLPFILLKGALWMRDRGCS